MNLADRAEIVRLYTATYIYVVANGYCRSVSDGSAEVPKHPAVGCRLLGGVSAKQPASPTTIGVGSGQRAKFESATGAGWITDPIMLVENEHTSAVSHIDLSDEELERLEAVLPPSISRRPSPPPPKTARTVVQKFL